MEEQKNKKEPIIIPRDISIPEYEIPENMAIWASEGDYSEGFKQLLSDLTDICLYVAKQLNEGPEVKDSVAKRVITLKSLIKYLIMRVFLNNIEREGILHQIILDLYYEYQQAEAVKRYKSMLEEQQKRATEDYAI